jgi:hypothetical protein
MIKSNFRPKNLFKIILFYTITLIIIFISTEILIGYYLYQSDSTKEFAISKFSNKIVNLWRRNLNQKIIGKNQVSNSSEFINSKYLSNVNPFISYAPDAIPIRFHPFLSYTNAHYSNGSFKNDFFGFRNPSNIYFTERNDSDFIIVMTGGSECAGYSHLNQTILENIKYKLIKISSKKNIKVLNLCMNGYTILNELQTYISLGYNLKPDVVISHSGWNDSLFGLLISGEFIKAGLIYNKWQEDWIVRLYGSSKEELNKSRIVHLENKIILANNYWIQINKFKNIVENNNGFFILGIQGYNKRIAEDDMKELHLATHEVFETTINQAPLERVNYIDFNNFNGIKFVDSCHSTQESVEFIASQYYQIIYKQFNSVL